MLAILECGFFTGKGSAARARQHVCLSVLSDRLKHVYVQNARTQAKSPANRVRVRARRLFGALQRTVLPWHATLLLLVGN